MTEDAIRKSLLEILAEIAPTVTVPQDQDARSLVDLGLDSLDVSGLLLGIEDKFGLKIPDDEADHLVTLNDYKAYIAERV